MKNYDDMEYFDLSEDLVNTIANDKLDQDRLFFRVIAAYYFSQIATMMQVNILTPDRGRQFPNTYAIALAPSGFGKGQSTSRIEKEVTNQFRDNFLNYTLPTLASRNLPKIAVERASKRGQDPDQLIEGLESEYKNLGVLPFTFNSATEAAIRQVRHKTLMAGGGSLNFQVDEIGNNLLGSADALSAFLELYDGSMPPKLIKNTNDNTRYEEIEGVSPANMLLFGTPVRLLNGGKTEDEFYDMLAVGYARRCFFAFHRSEKSTDLPSAADMFAKRVSSQKAPFLEKLADHLGDLADICFVRKSIVMPDDIAILFIEYEQANLKKARELSEHDELRAIELKGRHYKTLRLAGTYAFIDGAPEITEEHAYAAIKLAEDSGKAFDQLLTRDRSFVKLAKYIASVKRPVTQADMVEDLPFYKGSVQQKADMVQLAIAYGYQNNIIIKKLYEEGIDFYRGETIEKTDLQKLVVSYSKDWANDYQAEYAPFEDLHKLTQLDGYHWATHHFNNGHRAEEDAIEGFNMIVLDIDHGVNLSTAQMLLKDYKALFYTTRRHTPDEHRFRIVMPINYVLKLDGKDYKEFMKNLFEWLPFDVDEATGQRARKWLSHNGHFQYQDGELLDVLPFIPKTSKNEKFKKTQLDQIGMDNLERWVINNTGDGNRNNMLLRYAMILIDAGFDFANIHEKVSELNSKLDEPIPEAEITGTIMQTVNKKLPAAQAA